MNISEVEGIGSTLMQILECANLSFDAGNFTEALEGFKCAINMSSDSIEAQTGMALSLVHLCRYAEAIPLLVSLEAEMPMSLELQFLLGDALYCTGRLDEAELRLSSVIAKAPDYVDAQSLLGRVYMCLEKYPEANKCPITE